MSDRKFWNGDTPDKCDVCGAKLGTVFVDGKVKFGSWGIMCFTCHRSHGVGLGTGKGQKYKRIVENEITLWEKVGG